MSEAHTASGWDEAPSVGPVTMSYVVSDVTLPKISRIMFMPLSSPLDHELLKYE